MSDELAKVVVAVLRDAGLRVADEGMRVEDVDGGSLVQVKLLNVTEEDGPAVDDKNKEPIQPTGIPVIGPESDVTELNKLSATQDPQVVVEAAAVTGQTVENSTENGAVDGAAEEAK